MVKKTVVVADNAIPFLKGVLEPFAEVRYLPGKEISRRDLSDADALLVRTRTMVCADLLEGTPVKFVATATIGTDHLDQDYLSSKDIVWTNSPGCNASSVAQYVASALFSLSRRYGEPLRGKTVGIVGVGHVGSLVEKVMRTLGMNVLLCDPPRALREGPEKFVSLDHLLRQSDVVTLHVPLERSAANCTFRLANAEFIGHLRPDAWFINASRGEVVDGSALRLAIRGGSLGGAVLDVWENEPHIDGSLLDAVDFGTSHIAGYSRDGKANATTQIVRAFAVFFKIQELLSFSSDLPSDLPVLECDATGKSDEECVGDLLLKTYDIAGDSRNLKCWPSEFEKLRNEYPVRREPSAYKVRLRNASVALGHSLRDLGFTILAD